MPNELIGILIALCVLISFAVSWNSQVKRENAMSDARFEEDWEQANKDTLEQVFGGKKS